MAFVRILLADLVEKRLWPFALILVLVAIAVPVAISASGSPSPPPPLRLPPPPAQAAGLPAPGQALNAVAGPQTPHQEPYNSYERNPFRKPYGPRTASASTTPPVTAKPATPAPTPTSSSPVKAAPAPKGTGTPRTSPHVKSAPAPAPGSTGPATLAKFGPLDSYRMDLQLTDSTGQHTVTDVRRLSALPSPADPLLLFLGITKGGARAAFLLTRPVKFAPGFSGRCLPSPSACQIIELGSGQAIGLRLAGTPDTSPPFLSLAPAITIKAHSSPAAARTVRAQASPAGRSLLAKVDPAVRDALHYTVADGALTQRSPLSVKGL